MPVEQTIQTLSLNADGATVIVALTALRAAPAGGAGDVRSTAERTIFRDTCVRAGDTWKVKSREQQGDTQPHVPDRLRP